MNGHYGRHDSQNVKQTDEVLKNRQRHFQGKILDAVWKRFNSPEGLKPKHVLQDFSVIRDVPVGSVFFVEWPQCFYRRTSQDALLIDGR